MASTLSGHTGPVLSVAWKGDRIASGSADQTAIVWSTGNENKKELTLQGHTDWVRGVAFSNDGAQLATCSDDKTAVVWDSSSGSQITKLEGHGDFVNSVAWSPDNALIGTASKDKTAVVWDAVSGQQVSKLEGHSEVVTGVAWSSEGKATCSDDRTVVADGPGSSGTAGVEGSHAGARLAAGSIDATLGVGDVAGEAQRSGLGPVQNVDSTSRCCGIS
jgi:WD40 repeat protein